MDDNSIPSEASPEKELGVTIRPIEIVPNYLLHPPGSVLISVGNTKVLCTATVEERVPRFIYGSGNGWLSAEYSMLPGSTQDRKKRETGTYVSGRTKEIQRLIGRSLRSCIDMRKLRERTIWIDCDVIQADGGSRTASISGSFVALALAVQKLMGERLITENPIKGHIAAISVGIVDGKVELDLDYEKDFRADVDMNVVMNDKGHFIEVQGTAEGNPFTREQMNEMVDAAALGIKKIIEKQKEIIDISSMV
ncbi:MAG: ribonuclease PH [Candidatus Thermoplasmatota archaeon]|jgi:ribonuclease PH|nr:ribonuclease PH [Candidatus Thermoplasmatota archaeon]MDP7264437.1 ribonuclease PH [Candidatus Thermoplasmatota archaeon]MDP7420767.1 ribonuclease PH [bacterium]